MPTGIFEEDVRRKIYSQGAQPHGDTNLPYMCFRKYYAGKWRFFVLPKCLGPDGYQVWELEIIETTLAKVEIELLPIDRNLH